MQVDRLIVIMALSVQIGENTRVSGLCCVAVGDNLEVRGAFQVKLGTQITLPAPGSVKKEHLKETINIFERSARELRELILTYKAMGEQKYAPQEFVEQAEKAILVALDVIANKVEEFTKSLPEEKESVSD